MEQTEEGNEEDQEEEEGKCIMHSYWEPFTLNS